MKLIISGESREIEGVENLAQLVESLGADRRFCSVALNGEFVPHGDYEKTKVGESDDIEIVSPFPGG